LTQIVWEYLFLQSYQPCSEDEAIIITKFENRLRGTYQDDI